MKRISIVGDNGLLEPLELTPELLQNNPDLRAIIERVGAEAVEAAATESYERRHGETGTFGKSHDRKGGEEPHSRSHSRGNEPKP